MYIDRWIERSAREVVISGLARGTTSIRTRRRWGRGKRRKQGEG